MVLSWVAVPSGLTCKQIALRALPETIPARNLPLRFAVTSHHLCAPDGMTILP